MPMGVKASRGKRIAAAAMVQMGVPLRQVAKELGIGKDSAKNYSLDPTLDPQEVEQCKQRLAGRFVVAADRFLSHSLDRIKELGPYQAMLCAGIAHDHYLRAAHAASGAQHGSLTQVLVLIDQRACGQSDGT